MSASLPTISVVAYVYNGARWVSGMIESVLDQTHADFEFFFLDDGSTDGTGEIARRYARDPRMRYERQERKGRERLHETFNRCVEATRGEWVAIANGDDVLHPEKLARQLAWSAAHPHLDVIFHDAQFVDASGAEQPGSFLHADVDPHYMDTGRFAPFMFGRCLVPNPAAIFRRALFERIEGQEYGWAHDYQFWMKAAVHGARFGYRTDRLLRYRVHEESHSTSSGRKPRLLAEVDRMRREMRARYTLEQIYPEIQACRDRRQASAHAHLDLAVQLCRGNALELAVAELREAAALDAGVPEIRVAAGVLCAILGLGEEARVQLRAAVAENPSEAARHNLTLLESGAPNGYRLPPVPEGELYRIRRGPAGIATPADAARRAVPAPRTDAPREASLQAGIASLLRSL
jgi:glycosyltransferase involved in cell wall biosynthesis